MPNNYLSVLYKHIIQVENKNVVLKVGGTNIPLSPHQKGGGGVTCPLPPPQSPPPYSKLSSIKNEPFFAESSAIATLI